MVKNASYIDSSLGIWVPTMGSAALVDSCVWPSSLKVITVSDSIRSCVVLWWLVVLGNDLFV